MMAHSLHPLLLPPGAGASPRDYTYTARVDTCSSCRSELPPDSTFCPMCGAKRGMPDVEDTDPSATIPVPVATPLATPSPEFIPEPRGNFGQVSGTAAGQLSRKTVPLTAHAAEALALLDLGPDPRERAPRPPHQPVGVYRIPGTPARIPLSPRPGRIVFGAVVIAFALWSLLGFLPERAATLDDALYVAGTAGSLTLLVFGLFITVAGAVYRAQIEIICRRCEVQVIGWKRAFGLQCPLGSHYAKVSWLLVSITLLFWIAALTISAGLAWLVVS